MIVEMKKVSLVIYDKFREQSLKKLREIGVLHLVPLEGKGEEYEAISQTNEKLKRSFNLLPTEREDKAVEYKGVEESLKLADEIIEKSEQQKTLRDQINYCIKEIERIEALGDFDPAVVEALSGKGLGITIFMVNRSDEPLFNENGAFRIAVTKAKTFFAVVGKVPESLQGFDVFQMPAQGLDELNDKLDKSRKMLLLADEELGKMTSYKKALKAALREVGSSLEFEMVRSGINVEEKLSFLTGFCPVDSIDALKKESEKDGWGMLITEPEEEDAVPTKLKLGKFASLLEPVTNFMGILPGYRETDISFFFLCFFSVFTAMLIGDAGYGMLFLALSLVGIIGYSKKGKTVPKFFFLLMLLSVTTIIYGAITGTWFASKTIMSIGFFDHLKINAFRGTDAQQISLIMGISFFLGVLQLLIGVVQNFRKNFPKLSSFAQIGWFAVLVAIYYVVLTLVVRREGLNTYPKEMMYVLLGGVIIIFIFGGQEEGKSFVKGLLNSLANFLQLFLDVVGTFSDIMSYVRLFAVGLASVKIAETFNQLGAQMSHGPIIIFGILIVVLGHTINIILGLMAILVHAIRLNILEYSGKVGVEWSGFKYEPFRLDTDEN